ncbi:hypothetical protein Tco_1114443 [Tanacetum coccineum]|uniref:Maturase K n=1 Tax=Tanacetum coccineum TaxID=301880 RepID=A0ABQ5IWM1_9ASTR
MKFMYVAKERKIMIASSLATGAKVRVEELEKYFMLKYPLHLEGISVQRSECFFNLLSSSVEDSEGLGNKCVGRREILRNPFFITEIDKNAILEFSTIVSSELFDFDVILIFNSFDERHDGFSSSCMASTHLGCFSASETFLGSSLERKSTKKSFYELK